MINSKFKKKSGYFFGKTLRVYVACNVLSRKLNVIGGGKTRKIWTLVNYRMYYSPVYVGVKFNFNFRKNVRPISASRILTISQEKSKVSRFRSARVSIQNCVAAVFVFEQKKADVGDTLFLKHVYKFDKPKVSMFNRYIYTVRARVNRFLFDLNDTS